MLKLREGVFIVHLPSDGCVLVNYACISQDLFPFLFPGKGDSLLCHCVPPQKKRNTFQDLDFDGSLKQLFIN